MELIISRMDYRLPDRKMRSMANICSKMLTLWGYNTRDQKVSKSAVSQPLLQSGGSLTEKHSS